ncbi:MAG: DNA cytosine methyltransferase [Flavobacteriia bacterium]|nr:DNA cytosine methyltransferase [Flavobacteriia bacterium]
MKILNLYACLGGNRYLWSDEHEVTAVEYDEELARMYKERFPNDNVIVTDAHQFILDHYKEYEFIWSSPPCPTHSKVRVTQKNQDFYIPKYPDMSLYQQILFLEEHFEGKYVVENVIPYYTPLIPAKKRGRHLYWTNFNLPSNIDRPASKGIMCGQTNDEVNKLCEFHKIDRAFLDSYKGKQSKTKIIRNLVDYHVGKVILDTALGIMQKSDVSQTQLF